MNLTPDLLILSIVINRLTEVFKSSLPPVDEDAPTRFDRWRTLAILVASFVLGAFAVVLIFPASNLFPGAASALAGQIFTGIVLGGIANGIDFVASLGENISQSVNRLAAPKVETMTLSGASYTVKPAIEPPYTITN